MQTTLLGLAIAVILALVAALVGPLLIDWGGYRSVFEAEASHLIGVDVRVTGAIEARLLPSPQLVLHDIEIGRGEDKIGARSLGIEFALGPLMRGQWHAAELHLAGAQLRLGLDDKGRMQAPNIPINFSPDALSIDRLGIEDATVILGDAANGAGIKLEKLWFNGDARSLIGPFSGEGATTIGGELYPFRLSTGRASDDGVLKLRLNIDPVNHPLSIALDGLLTFAAVGPSFDGTLSLARPVGIAARSAALVTQPWRVSGKLKATPASALMQQGEFQYGSDDQGFKLTGTAEFKFGKHPRFDGVLSGRQIDLDRALAAGQWWPFAAGRGDAQAGRSRRVGIPPDLSDPDRRRHRPRDARRRCHRQCTRRYFHRRRRLESRSDRVSRARLHASAAERPACGRRDGRCLYRAGRDRGDRSESLCRLDRRSRGAGAKRVEAAAAARRRHAVERRTRHRTAATPNSTARPSPVD